MITLPQQTRRRRIRKHISRASARVTGGGLGAFLIRAVVGNGAVRLGAMIASFAVGVQLARGLGVEAYGYYSVALAIITIAGIPGELGISYLVMRDVAAASTLNDDSKLFAVLNWAKKTCAFLSLGVAACIVAIATVMYFVGSRQLAAVLLLGAPIVPLIASARVRAGALMGLKHVVRGQIPNGLLRPVIFSVLLALASLTLRKIGAPTAMALSSVTAAMVLVVAHLWLKSRLPPPPPIVEDSSQSKGHWLVRSIPMGLMEGMRILQAELTIVLVSAVAAPSVAGLLRIANVTAMTAAVAFVVIVQVSLPVMASLYAQKDHDRLQKTVTAIAQAQFAGVVLVSLPLLLFPKQLLAFAFGPEFSAAAVALQILLVGQVASGSFGPNVWLLNMTHHEWRVARALGIALVMNIVAIPPLTLMWGLTGAATGFVVSMFCWNVIAWHDAKTLLGIETSIIHWPWRTGRPAQ